MDTDSEREKSSDPVLVTSSENRTFHGHDEDDEDSDCSSLSELENEVGDDKVPNYDGNCAASRNDTEAKAIEFNQFERPEPVEVGETSAPNSGTIDKGVTEVKVIKITGNLVNSSESEGEREEELAQAAFTPFKSKSNEQQCDLSETIQAPREIDAECAVPPPTLPPPILKADAAEEELCSGNARTDLRRAELENVATKTPFFKANNFVNPEKLSAAVSHREQPVLSEAYFGEGAQCLETCLELGAVAVDEENLRDSYIRESVECYYSAQDLLEYGHMLSSGRKTPDIESGYFERSESDISRDDNEVIGGCKIKQRSAPKPRSTQFTNMSEGLRAELNRFKAMIETIEKDRLCSDADGRQETIDSVVLAERNYDENLHGIGVADQQDVTTMTTVPATATMQRGYWSTVFGQASQIESGSGVELTLDERFADIEKAHRALELLEDYHSRLSEPQDRALRIAIERVIRIFKSRLFQALLARDFMQAYRHQSQCIQSVVKMLQQLKDENWCLPLMYTVCLDLRILAQRCEELGSSSNKPGEILEKAADCLMSCFRVCAADNRSSDDETKRLGMLNLVNQLFKVYFRINKLHLCKPLIRAIDSSTFKDSFPLPEQITYKYFVGRKAMFDSDYKSADEFLSFALQNCPRNFPRNKRLILIYLVPVKMLLGYLPKRQILERFDLLQFHELAVALKEGNVRKFDEVIQRHEIFFIKCGIYLLVEKLKFIVYRNLFKKVYLIKQTHQLDLGAFRAALQFVGETDMSIDETHCIVANLIFEGKIKGYISHSHNKLVVSKQNPFPPLNTVS